MSKSFDSGDGSHSFEPKVSQALTASLASAAVLVLMSKKNLEKSRVQLTIIPIINGQFANQKLDKVAYIALTRIIHVVVFLARILKKLAMRGVFIGCEKMMLGIEREGFWILRWESKCEGLRGEFGGGGCGG